jgi:hypothetical protein
MPSDRASIVQIHGAADLTRRLQRAPGLLRQIGDFGVLLCKDFTSVLAQNKDACAEAMAALREVYDVLGIGQSARTAVVCCPGVASAD